MNKKTISIITIVIILTSITISTVSSTSNFLRYAETLANAKVISKFFTESGYRLGDYALRQEVAAMMMSINNPTYPTNFSCLNKFRDVSSTKPNTWVCKIVETALAKNLIASNSTFRPEANITRAEALAMVLKGKGISTPTISSSSFSDVKEGWQRNVCEAALNNKIISANTYFRPNDPITRGELFVIVTNAIGLKADKNIISTKGLSFGVMLHLEGQLLIPNKEKYLQINNTLKKTIDLFKKYEAKITIESEMPYIEAANKWGDNMLLYALDNGMGVGTHCDFDSMSQEAAVTAYKTRKDMVDAVVGAENNLGCSGGWGTHDWAKAAYNAGFSYLDGPVMIAYMAIPEENRPINPDTGKYYANAEISPGIGKYYHDPIPTDLKDAIYPRRLKDTSDLIGDTTGVVLIPGSLGEISSLSEGRSSCFPNCALTKDDINYIFEKINYINGERDNSKTSSLYLHFPDYTLKESGNIEIIENWLKQMQEYQNQGKIKWKTIKEIYEEYAKTKTTSTSIISTPSTKYLEGHISINSTKGKVYASMSGYKNVNVYDTNTLKQSGTINFSNIDTSNLVRLYIDEADNVALIYGKKTSNMSLFDLSTDKVKCTINENSGNGAIANIAEALNQVVVIKESGGIIDLYDYNCNKKNSYTFSGNNLSTYISESGEIGLLNQSTLNLSIINLSNGTITKTIDLKSTLGASPDHAMVLTNKYIVISKGDNSSGTMTTIVYIYNRSNGNITKVTTSGDVNKSFTRTPQQYDNFYFISVQKADKTYVLEQIDLDKGTIIESKVIPSNLLSFNITNTGAIIYLKNDSTLSTKIEITPQSSGKTTNINNNKCGDGTCDNTEKTTGKCPQDCN